jgi:hypothetical protein
MRPARPGSDEYSAPSLPARVRYLQLRGPGLSSGGLLGTQRPSFGIEPNGGRQRVRISAQVTRGIDSSKVHIDGGRDRDRSPPGTTRDWVANVDLLYPSALPWLLGTCNRSSSH